MLVSSLPPDERAAAQLRLQHPERCIASPAKGSLEGPRAQAISNKQLPRVRAKRGALAESDSERGVKLYTTTRDGTSLSLLMEPESLPRGGLVGLLIRYQLPFHRSRHWRPNTLTHQRLQPGRQRQQNLYVGTLPCSASTLPSWPSPKQISPSRRRSTTVPSLHCLGIYIRIGCSASRWSRLENRFPPWPLCG